jgi:hypothetical protein
VASRHIFDRTGSRSFRAMMGPSYHNQRDIAQSFERLLSVVMIIAFVKLPKHF